MARAEVGGVRLAVVHETGQAAGREQRCADRFTDCDVLVFGHSHIPWDSVAGPRTAAAQPGFADRPAPSALRDVHDRSHRAWIADRRDPPRHQPAPVTGMRLRLRSRANTVQTRSADPPMPRPEATC